MFDADYFLSGLPMQVIAHHNAAHVRIVTDDHDYLVRDVARTYAGAVMVNVWVDANGLAPIVPTSSNLHEFEVLPPAEHQAVTIPFDHIVEVVVVPARQAFGRFSFL